MANQAPRYDSGTARGRGSVVWGMWETEKGGDSRTSRRRRLFAQLAHRQRRPLNGSQYDIQSVGRDKIVAAKRDFLVGHVKCLGPGTGWYMKQESQ